MRYFIATFALFLFALSASSADVALCKTPATAASCKWIHGRLEAGNGTPAVRLWQIGTHHLYEISSTAIAENIDALDNENPHLPSNLQTMFQSAGGPIYGDFEVCSLETVHRGAMQRACIASAKNLRTRQKAKLK